MKAYRTSGLSWIQVIQTETDKAIIEDFFVDPDGRGKGVGTRLMEATCKDADREGVTLYLTPMPMGAYGPDEEKFYPPNMTYKELCAFYRTFGFRFQRKPLNEQMKRKPKGE